MVPRLSAAPPPYVVYTQSACDQLANQIKSEEEAGRRNEVLQPEDKSTQVESNENILTILIVKTISSDRPSKQNDVI